MLYDLTARDACFAEGRPPADIDELLQWSRLHLDGRPPWRLISARRKFGRVLLEIEEDAPSGPRRLIGKFADYGRAATLYQTLRSLRDAGFAPPERYTVPEPVAFVGERGFVLQEKVPGEQAAQLLTKEDTGRSAAVDSANWLAALRYCRLQAPSSGSQPQPVLDWVNDLVSTQPSEAGRIRRIADAIVCELAQPASGFVPCHGDFHPKNIFIANPERVTAIDIDKFGMREPESDVAWFLMQAAAFGFFERGSFECTDAARRTFIEQYEGKVGRPMRSKRLRMYMAMAFLKNLHFELVLLKTGRKHYADPWLRGAESAIIDGNLHLTP
jgi:aminoglycoside phosphotransferase (APT) family kinase protein